MPKTLTLYFWFDVRAGDAKVSNVMPVYNPARASLVVPDGRGYLGIDLCDGGLSVFGITKEDLYDEKQDKSSNIVRVTLDVTRVETAMITIVTEFQEFKSRAQVRAERRERAREQARARAGLPKKKG